VSLHVVGPDGSIVFDSRGTGLPGDQAHYFPFAGLRRDGQRWLSGLYRGEFQMTRGQKIVLRAQRSIDAR